jgi:hypothetical protein
MGILFEQNLAGICLHQDGVFVRYRFFTFGPLFGWHLLLGILNLLCRTPSVYRLRNRQDGQQDEPYSDNCPTPVS